MHSSLNRCVYEDHGSMNFTSPESYSKWWDDLVT